MRSLNFERTTGNLKITAVSEGAGIVTLRGISERWFSETGNWVRRTDAFGTAGAPLICSFSELNNSDLVFDYNHLDDDDSRFPDTSGKGWNGTCHGVIHKIADPVKNRTALFGGDGYVEVPGLGPAFPSAGCFEVWANNLEPLTTILSVTDDITLAKKFAVEVSDEARIRVFQTLSSGLVNIYDGRVPLDSGWHHIFVSWTPASHAPRFS